jgi:CheY-like chemotaxis protein
LAVVRKPRILIVEDNSDVRRLYAIGLNQRGFEVKLAANGAEAVERITNGETPDVILLDWLMPLMDGGEVLSRLDGQLNSATIIVISGQTAPPPDGRDPRIQAWLTKPVSLEQLIADIQRPRAVPEREHERPARID